MDEIAIDTKKKELLEVIEKASAEIGKLDSLKAIIEAPAGVEDYPDIHDDMNGRVTIAKPNGNPAKLVVSSDLAPHVGVEVDGESAVMLNKNGKFIFTRSE